MNSISRSPTMSCLISVWNAGTHGEVRVCRKIQEAKYLDIQLRHVGRISWRTVVTASSEEAGVSLGLCLVVGNGSVLADRTSNYGDKIYSDCEEKEDNCCSWDTSGLWSQDLIAKFLQRVVALSSFLPSNLKWLSFLANSILKPHRKGILMWTKKKKKLPAVLANKNVACHQDMSCYNCHLPLTLCPEGDSGWRKRGRCFQIIKMLIKGIISMISDSCIFPYIEKY